MKQTILKRHDKNRINLTHLKSEIGEILGGTETPGDDECRNVTSLFISLFFILRETEYIVDLERYKLQIISDFNPVQRLEKL